MVAQSEKMFFFRLSFFFLGHDIKQRTRLICHKNTFAQSTGAVEYTVSISTEG